MFECHACRDADEDMPRIVVEVSFGTLYSARCPVCKEALTLVEPNSRAVRLPGDES